MWWGILCKNSFERTSRLTSYKRQRNQCQLKYLSLTCPKPYTPLRNIEDYNSFFCTHTTAIAEQRHVSQFLVLVLSTMVRKNRKFATLQELMVSLLFITVTSFISKTELNELGLILNTTCTGIFTLLCLQNFTGETN